MKRQTLLRLGIGAAVAALMAEAIACGGDTPVTPTPVGKRWTLQVSVTNEQDQAIAAASVRVMDGANAGRTATTSAQGIAVLSDLAESGFTIEVTADNFWTQTSAVTLTSSLSVTVRLKARPPNLPPRILALVANSRAEVGEDIPVVATVEDDVTPIDQLEYRWTATAGTFSGTGRKVMWTAPKDRSTPDAFVLTLTVVERYSTGGSATAENKTSASATVHVNDSTKEITEVSMTFLRDFSTYSVTPEQCVRNFSNSCRGKAEELSNIQDNRKEYHIQSGTSHVDSIVFNAPRTWADINAPCEFRSIVTNPSRPDNGKLEVASGICLLTAVYEDYQWWLCDSHFRGSTTSGFRFIF
jgi:hypothetical protein